MENVDLIVFKAMYWSTMAAVVYAILLRPVYRVESSMQFKFLMEVVAIALFALNIGDGADLQWIGIGIPFVCAAILWKLHIAGILREIRAEAIRLKLSK